MAEEVKSDEKEGLSETISTPKKPRPTKETWLKARIDYETGNYQGMRELALRYDLDYKALRDKAYKEDWKEFKTSNYVKIHQKIEEKALSKVDLLFSRLEKKAEKYERMVEVSQENLGSRASDGTPLLDPDAIETYAKTESRIIDWYKLALGITDKVQVSGDLNINVVAILEKLRGMERKPIDVESEEAELSTCKLVEG